jgi:hypothetical protein
MVLTGLYAYPVMFWARVVSSETQVMSSSDPQFICPQSDLNAMEILRSSRVLAKPFQERWALLQFHSGL